MRPYEMGNPELDTKIRELVDAAGGGDNPELIHELIVTALKLARDRAQRGDLKLLNAPSRRCGTRCWCSPGTRTSRR